MSDVVVVMSSYNGEKYIDAQLESLVAQSFRHWCLLVRDDGSSDATLEILDRYAIRDSRITRLPVDGLRLGPWASFGLLLQSAYDRGARYVFMCDQDDVWENDKIETELLFLKQAEKRWGQTCPLLVHSDLSVVNANLDPIHRSYRAYQGVSYDLADPLRTLLLHNAVLGCTALANRPLLQLALPFPAGADHDWWLAQCAAASGQLLDLGRPTVRYRHHQANTGGAPGRRAALATLFRTPRRFISSFMPRFDAALAQAHNLEVRILERLGDSPTVKRIATYRSAFATRTNYLKRLRAFWRSGVRPRRKGSYVFLPIILLMFPLWKNGRGNP